MSPFTISVCAPCYFVVHLSSWDLPVHSNVGCLATRRAQLQGFFQILRLRSERQFIHPDRVSDSLRSRKRQFQRLKSGLLEQLWDGSVFTAAALQLCSAGAELASNITSDLCHSLEVKPTSVVFYRPPFVRSQAALVFAQPEAVSALPPDLERI